jgi:hypothetical protein
MTSFRRTEGAFRFWFHKLTKPYMIYCGGEVEMIRWPTYRTIFEKLTEPQRAIVAADPARFRQIYKRL